MRRRVGIMIAIVAVAIAAVAASWATASQKPRGVQARSSEILTKSGHTTEGLSQLNAQIAAQGREEERSRYSGSTLWTWPQNLPDGVDQETAEALARIFRQQAPTPADRIEHFRWLADAQGVVTFVGWGAGINAVEPRGDELRVELRVWPHLESAWAIGGLTHDHYFERYVVRDGQLHYLDGRPPNVVRREVRPNPEAETVIRFD